MGGMGCMGGMGGMGGMMGMGDVDLNAGLGGGGKLAHDTSEVDSAPVVSLPRIDPDVQELCDHFHIEERHALRLTDCMRKREATFEADMERLYDVLERANSPAGLLVVKMREMDEGTFVGAMRADKELKAIVKKFAVDATAEAKLADILSRYPAEKKKEYYGEIERHLETSARPSAMAMMLLKKLGSGESLGRPGPVAPGSYLDKQRRDGDSHRDRDRDRDRDRGDRGDRRDRDRDRDRRSRSRRR